jgi:hypothetical protein
VGPKARLDAVKEGKKKVFSLLGIENRLFTHPVRSLVPIPTELPGYIIDISYIKTYEKGCLLNT